MDHEVATAVERGRVAVDEHEIFAAEVIDEDVGAANVLHFVNTAGQDVIVAANRETDQIAMYTFAN